MQNAAGIIMADQAGFLRYLKSKFTLIHLSNVFFRDLHYGVLWYLRKNRGLKLGHTEAEKVAREVGEALEKSGVFRKIDRQSWLLLYPEFALPRPEKQAPAA